MKSISILCVTSFFKGEDFMIGAKEAGCTVYLLTSHKLKNEPWPTNHIDETFFIQQDINNNWNMEHVKAGIAHLLTSKKIDRVVSLDDFDVEKGAEIREEFRIPGMGQTTARYFRDKLAMRIQAKDNNIAVPAFSKLFNNDEINHYLDTVPGPWLIKPRSEASATGITKVHTKDEAWAIINKKGDRRSNFLIEAFRPGDVYHVDSISYEGKIVFTCCSRYLATPMEVAHGGGIFRSMTVETGSEDDKALRELNAKVLKAFGMQYSASHSEYIKSKETGEFLFLETSSRVGGAHLAEMVYFAKGVNLWKEWARLERAMAANEKYKIPKSKDDTGGIIVSLARQEHPDQNCFNAKEVVWKLNKANHVGCIVTSESRARVIQLLDEYAGVVAREFHASAPVPNRAKT